MKSKNHGQSLFEGFFDGLFAPIWNVSISPMDRLSPLEWTYAEIRSNTKQLELKDNRMIATFEVPGHAKEDLSVSYWSKSRILAVIPKDEKATARHSYKLFVPYKIEETSLEATCKNGILTVTAEIAKPAEQPSSVTEIEVK
jgi:HSP20 family molecular chaperone IbpA